MARRPKALPIDLFGFSDVDKIRHFEESGIYFKSNNVEITLDTPIFRYISYENLQSMLIHSSLYVSNRCRFTDLRERDGEDKFIPTPNMPFKIEYVPSYRDRRRVAKMKQEEQDALNLCVSCWTTDRICPDGPVENFLMWQAYRKGDLMCRVGTTIKKLIQHIRPECDVVIANVIYDSICGSEANRITFTKPKCYLCENEVRVVPLIAYKDHVDLPIENIWEMVDSITISPFISRNIECLLEKSLKAQAGENADKIKLSMLREYPEV